MQTSRLIILFIVLGLMIAAPVSPGFSAPTPEPAPAWITFSISIPKAVVMTQLEAACPIESPLDAEFDQYGIHFRNLKITRQHLKLNCDGDELIISTPATASFEIKAALIPKWEKVTSEMIAGLRITPSLDANWSLHLNAEPLLKITKVENIGTSKLGDLLSNWLKTQLIQPQVSEFEDVVKRSDFVKAAVEEATKQMAGGIKVDGKSPVWVQINVQTLTQPEFTSDQGSFICQTRAKAVVVTTKGKPKAKSWNGMPKLSLNDLEVGLPNNGQITLTFKDQCPQPHSQALDLNLDLTIPAPIKGHGNITLSETNFDKLAGALSQ